MVAPRDVENRDVPRPRKGKRARGNRNHRGYAVTISRAWAVQQLSVTLRCIAHPLVLPPSFRYPSPRSRTVLLGRMAGPQPACDANALGPEARGSAVCAACLEPSV